MTNYLYNQSYTTFRSAYSAPRCIIWQMNELLLNSTSPTPPDLNVNASEEDAVTPDMALSKEHFDLWEDIDDEW